MKGDDDNDDNNDSPINNKICKINIYKYSKHIFHMLKLFNEEGCFSNFYWNDDDDDDNNNNNNNNNIWIQEYLDVSRDLKQIARPFAD